MRATVIPSELSAHQMAARSNGSLIQLRADGRPEERTLEHIVEQTVELAESGEAGDCKSTARPAPTLQQSRNLLVKLGLLEPQSTVPRLKPKLQCFLLAKLGAPGLERKT